MDDLWEEFPLFAPEGAEIPKVGDGESAENVSSAMGALSHLLYDEETPEEISELLRDNGNRLFRQGKRQYKAAIEKYTEAIAANCDIPEVTAAAYANRAAAELKMQNFGRCLQDCESCLALQPDNIKARYRAAISATALQRFEKAIMHCEKGIASSGGDDKEDKDNLTLFQKTKAGAERARENAAKKEQEAAARENAAELADKRRTETLVKRGVEMGLALFAQQRSYATTCVTIGDDGLTWPVLVLYPEEAIGISGVGDQSDYLEHVHEETTLLDIVRTLFPPKEQGPEWDKRGVYSSFDKLEVLFRGDWTMTEDEADSDDERTYVGSMRGPEEVGAWRTLDTSLTLRKAIATNGYVVPLFPVFYVVPKGVYLS